MDSLSSLSTLATRPVPPALKLTQDESRTVTAAASDNPGQPSATQIDGLNKLLQVHQQHLSFSIDESSGVSVLRVIDSESGDVIRQMPSESWLKLARELTDSTTGLLRTHA